MKKNTFIRMLCSHCGEGSIFGWLRRKGHGGLWHKRFASLEGEDLNLYKDENRRVVDRAVKINPDTEIETISPNRFTISNNENGIQIFNCTTQEEATKWVTALKAATNPTPPLSMDDFHIISVIGRGYYGKVMLVNKIGTNDLYAIKSIHKRLLIESGKTCQVITERNTLMASKSPFLVKLHFAFQTESKFYIGLEYVPGGDLRFNSTVFGCYPLPDAKLYTAEILAALEYLHSVGIVYRDLKLENCLLDAEGHVKIVDFGLAKNLRECKTTQSFCGTSEYLAPEILQEKPYDYRVDEWALGILMCEIFFGHHPFHADNQTLLYKNIIEKEPNIPNDIDNDLDDIIRKLLTKDYHSRLTVSQLKSHPFFAEYDWNKLLNKEYQPIFVPESKDPLSLTNFDSSFTNECAADSFVQPAFGDISNLQGFSFFNTDL